MVILMEKGEIEQDLNNLQNESNKLYEAFGATEEILNLQIAINKLRNKFDIPDKSKMTDSNPGFVQ